MSVANISDLRADAAAAIEAYLTKLESSLCGLSQEAADEVLREARVYFLETLEPEATPDDVARVVHDFGEPDEYASELCAQIRGIERPSGDPRSGSGQMPAGEAQGSFLGMPYDMRIPTPERIQSRWWSPTDPRIWVPKAFGLGWTINFGALAVKLHLIRPDDEDEPFASVPERWLIGALLVPMLLSVAVIVMALVYGSRLPAELPIHWDAAGRPDDFARAGALLAFTVAACWIPTAWALWAVFARRGVAARALTAAAASLFASLALGQYAAAVAWGLGITRPWHAPVAVLVAVIVPFAMLVTLARVDRREAWRADLG